MNVRKLVVLLCVLALPAAAVSPSDKALLQSQVSALKSTVDALALDVPPGGAWSRATPDLLDIDLTGPRSIIQMSDVTGGPLTGGARWLNPSIPDWNNVKGTATQGALVFHYSDLNGVANPASGPACDMSKGWVNWDCKFTSYDTCPVVKWGVESNGLHYLESCTDGSRQSYVCNACRITDWKATRFSFPEVYYRFMLYAYPESWANQGDIGVKLTGVGGRLATGGTFAEIFELGRTNPATGGWVLQAYRYDGEGAQGATIFTGIYDYTDVRGFKTKVYDIQPGRWYTFEGHVKVETTLGAGDGVIEFKVDGQMVFSRLDVKMGALAIQGFNPLIYQGGTLKPNGVLRYKHARYALSTRGWIGPAPEVQ